MEDQKINALAPPEATKAEVDAVMTLARQQRALQLATKKLDDERERVKKAKRKERAEKKIEKAEREQAPEPTFSDIWFAASEKLLKTNPKLYFELQKAHDRIAENEAEVAEIVAGVEKGLRAEIRTAATWDSAEIFPRPDLAWSEIFAQVSAEGTCNYGALEAMVATNEFGESGVSNFIPGSKEKLEPSSPESIYRFLGFRTRLGHEVLKDITDALILYALRTLDTTKLNWSIVDAAIEYRNKNGAWAANDREIAALTLMYRGINTPSSLSIQEQVVFARMQNVEPIS